EARRDDPHAALDRGLARASGEIGAWLNADDLFHPDAIERAAAAFAAKPSAVLAFGDLDRLHADGVRERVVHPPDTLARAGAGEVSAAFVTPLCCFWRRETLRSLGPYDATLRIVADRDLWLRLVSRVPVPVSVHTGSV